jgi:hypothetical protein
LDLELKKREKKRALSILQYQYHPTRQARKVGLCEHPHVGEESVGNNLFSARQQVKFRPSLWVAKDGLDGFKGVVQRRQKLTWVRIDPESACIVSRELLTAVTNSAKPTNAAGWHTHLRHGIDILSALKDGDS